MRFFKIFIAAAVATGIAFFSAADGFTADKKIVINLAVRSLALYDGNTKIRLYPIAIGKPSTPTPVGYFKIRSKDVNPTWTDPSNYANSIPSGPNNPLGYRWMEIQGNYGIHGTNNPNSIGHYVSNGCIRMQEKNVEELFDMVSLGTPVEITYNRVVVEKTPEGVVAFYVYPDSYGRQKLSVDAIRVWLKGYGVDDFVTDADILAKINASDGAPTLIGKSYAILVKGEKLNKNAVEKDGIIYLPINAISEKLSEKYSWDNTSNTIATNFATAKGIVKNNNVYFDAKDLDSILRVKGALNKDKVFVIGDYAQKGGNTAPVPPVTPVTPLEDPNIQTNTVEQKGATEAVKTENTAENINSSDNANGNVAEIKDNADKTANKDVKSDNAAADVQSGDTALKDKADKASKKKGKPVIVRKDA